MIRTNGQATCTTNYKNTEIKLHSNHQKILATIDSSTLQQCVTGLSVTVSGSLCHHWWSKVWWTQCQQCMRSIKPDTHGQLLPAPSTIPLLFLHWGKSPRLHEAPGTAVPTPITRKSPSTDQGRWPLGILTKSCVDSSFLQHSKTWSTPSHLCPHWEFWLMFISLSTDHLSCTNPADPHIPTPT